jgi:crossover junction endodeoxyribonuclease RuvC
MEVKVVGVDPGFGHTGVAVLTGPPPRLMLTQQLDCPERDADHRIAHYAREFDLLLTSHRPNLVAIESQYFTPHGGDKTAAIAGAIIKVALVRGALIGVAATHSIPTTSVAPAAAKRALTGRADAGKAEMIKFASLTFGIKLRAREEHLADALGIALVGLQKLLIEIHEKA